MNSSPEGVPKTLILRITIIALTEYISLVTALLCSCLVLVKLSILAMVINSYRKSKLRYAKEEKQRDTQKNQTQAKPQTENHKLHLRLVSYCR